MPRPLKQPAAFPISPVEPDLTQWPIARLSRDRKAFMDDVAKETVRTLLERYPEPHALHDLLAQTIYHEKIRLTRTPWRVDPPDEKDEWAEIQRKLAATRIGQDYDAAGLEELLVEITGLYVQEITGNFRIPTYRFAKKVLPKSFNLLLNAYHSRNFQRVVGNRYAIHDRIHLVGEIEKLRKLSAKGTLLMVPTHFSNLDSILLGWAIDAIGLPALTYGAGLNLFSARILAYFMNRLGAYKVDRRKKNRVYMETLKIYSTQALERGCHMLFFPGGTRSRSGSMEKHLKLGLMGTGIEAQRRLIEQAGETGEYRKIFVAPLVMSYNFVLEAPVLINEHLKRTGQERYFVEQDRFSTSTKMLRFILRFLRASSTIYLSFGAPMDILGNPVDEEGNSLDARGNKIDLRDYFLQKGALSSDGQRDQEFTRMTADKILASFYRDNVALSTHVVAFAAFRLLEKRYKLDLYELLRIPDEDCIWTREEMENAVADVVAELLHLDEQERIRVEPMLTRPAAQILDHGIGNLGIFHDKRALMIDKSGTIISQDLNLLYFYHNRLNGYELERVL